jgi:hypothetical protein
MKRLRDMHDDDPALQQAQQLLGAVDPLQGTDARMRRVRQGLEARRAGAGRRVSTPRRRVLLLTVALVFAFSALAAAQGLGVLRAVMESLSEQVEPSAARPAARRAPRGERKRAAAPVPQLEPARGTAEALAPAAPAGNAGAPAPASAPELRGGAEATAARPRATQARSADSESVRRAVIALRRDGDAERAARLLEEVHARSPHGPLAEEVMSLRVEAALARKDRRARGYAQEYLAAYPQGRYRALALRALAGSP